MILKIKEIQKKNRKNYEIFLKCDECNDEYSKIVSESRHSGYKLKKFHFCSLKCTRISQSSGKLRGSAYRPPTLPIFVKNCNVCSLSREIKEYDLSPEGFFFCSKKCVYDAQRIGGVTYEKRKQNCIETYNVPFPMSRKEVKEKRQHSVFEKYGVESVFQLNSVKEKMKQTSRIKYGVAIFSQTEEFKKKIEETNNKKFGHKSPIENPDILEKRNKTMLYRWGAKSTFESSILRKKFEDTMIEKYGYHTIALVPAFISSSMDKKMLNSCGKTWKEYIDDLPEYNKYRRSVDQITRKQNVSILKNYDKWGDYHLDHKFSVAEGYRQGISADIIGNIVNLEFIPKKENMQKNSNCSISKNELLLEYSKKVNTNVKQ